MLLVAAILAATLTRAEIIERFRAAPVTMCEGLVQVWADCPADMRREYQLPIAGCLADVCRALYLSQGVRPRRFETPLIVARIGSVTTNDATVVTAVSKTSEGTPCFRIWIPAPGFADVRQLRLAAARGWTLALKGSDPGEAAAWDALVDTDPVLRVAVEAADLKAWRERGEYVRERDDEDYLRLQRSVLRPGFATREEVLTFASRLMLYPSYYDCPFRGRYSQLDFHEAIRFGKDDILVRYAAFQKANQVVVWGGGRGDALQAVADSYADFLRAFARGETETAELERMLESADLKLKEMLE